MYHKDAIRLFLEQEENAVGDLAEERVSKLDFIEYKNGFQAAEGIGREEVEEVIQIFEEIQGDAVYGIFRNSLRGKIDADDKIDLPSKVIPRKIREKKFLSSF